jgi:phosphohistidine phosphatase
MERDLLLLRHAKSDWEAGESDDHDRPLAPRGLVAAKRVGGWIAANGLAPDLAVSSTAVRAAETARLVLRSGRLEAPLRLERRFYQASVEAMLEAIRALDDRHGSVLLVGHEPTWSALVSLLIGGGRVRVPTAGLAGIRFELASWADVEPGSGELRFLVTPKALP